MCRSKFCLWLGGQVVAYPSIFWVPVKHDALLCRMEPVVLACSALKPEYRVVLQGGDGTANSSSSVAWVRQLSWE